MRREMKGLKEPILFSETIRLSRGVKYLGIILGKGLTWKKQLDKAINKPTRPSGHAETHLVKPADLDQRWYIGYTLRR
jgi:hypothetical protein